MFINSGLLSAILLFVFIRTLNAQNYNWTKMSDMVYKCAGFSACEIDGKIYAVGGTNGTLHNGQYGETYLQIYDIQQNKWSLGPLMKYPRMSPGVVVSNGKIYSIGGGWSFYLSKKIEVYDPVLKTWTEKTERPKSGSIFGICAVGSKIYTFGGESGDGKFPGFIYDIETDSWSDMAEIKIPTGGLAYAYKDGKIYAFGGVSYNSTIKTVQVYDIATDKWEIKTDMPLQRFGAVAAVKDGKIYIFGGAVFPENIAKKDIQIYDIETDSWTIDTQFQLPLATQWPAIASCSSSGDIYLMGGEDRCMMTYTNAVLLKTVYKLELETSKSEEIIDSDNQILYPNPAVNYLQINIDKAIYNGAIIAEISDMKGNILISEIIDSNNTMSGVRIDIETLSPGIYNLVLSSDDKIQTVRFVKQ